MNGLPAVCQGTISERDSFLSGIWWLIASLWWAAKRHDPQYKRPCLLTENYCEYGVTHLSAVAAVPQFYWQPGIGLNTPVSGIEQTGSPAV